MILHCAQVQKQLGISRRAALKLGREMGAMFTEGDAGTDFSTTELALNLWLTLPTLQRAAQKTPLDPLRKAAVEMAAAVLLEHQFDRDKILTTAA